MEKIHKAIGKIVNFFVKNPLFIAVLITWLLNQLLKRNPHLTEVVYSQGIYPKIALIVSSFSNLFPFSVNDLLYTLLVIILLLIIVLLMIKRIKPLKALHYIAKTFALVFILFYWFWGFNYFRDSVYERMGFKASPVNNSELNNSFQFILNEVVSNYKPSFELNFKKADSSIEESYQELANLLVLDFPNGHRRSKHILYSRYFAGASISGYFGPFCNEIQINKYLLPIQIPAILAHEKAHQFGITNEAEASFIAWLVCQNSSLTEVKYSANLFILMYFLREIRNEDYFETTIASIPPYIKDDIDTIRSHWAELRYPMINKIQSELYDWYLKGNNIPQGVDNYQGVVKLICDYRKTHDMTGRTTNSLNKIKVE